MVSAFTKLISFLSDNVLPPLFITWVTLLTFFMSLEAPMASPLGICFGTSFSLPKILWPSHNFRAGILCCILSHLSLVRATSLQSVSFKQWLILLVLCISRSSYKGQPSAYFLEYSSFHSAHSRFVCMSLHKTFALLPTPHALCNPFNFTASGYKKLIQENLTFEMGSLSIHITKYKVQRGKKWLRLQRFSKNISQKLPTWEFSSLKA